MTTELCVQTCASKGFSVRWNAVENRVLLWHQLRKVGARRKLQRAMRRNPHEICGGNLANTVYRVR